MHIALSNNKSFCIIFGQRNEAKFKGKNCIGRKWRGVSFAMRSKDILRYLMEFQCLLRWKRRQVENPVKPREKDLNKDSELASNANRTSYDLLNFSTH